MKIEIASSDKKIYSGQGRMVVATAANGEIGFLPRHTPYLAELKPGNVRITTENATEEVFYISGGVIEVQPDSVSVLVDVAERAQDLDEAKAVLAKERAERTLKENADKIECAVAKAELVRAMAQIRLIQKLKDKAK